MRIVQKANTLMIYKTSWAHWFLGAGMILFCCVAFIEISKDSEFYFYPWWLRGLIFLFLSYGVAGGFYILGDLKDEGIWMIRVDQSKRICDALHKNLFGYKQVWVEFNIDDLKDLKIKEVNSAKGKTSYYIEVVLKTGRIEALPISSNKRADCESAIRKINLLLQPTNLLSKTT